MFLSFNSLNVKTYINNIFRGFLAVPRKKLRKSMSGFKMKSCDFKRNGLKVNAFRVILKKSGCSNMSTLIKEINNKRNK